MKRLRYTALLVALSVASSVHAAGTWERQIEFAKKLATLQYYDIADIVLARVEQSPNLIGILKANALRQIGDYYSFIASGVAATQAGLQGYIDSLEKASEYYKKYIAHRSPKREDRFDARMQLSRVSLAIAEAHLQIYRDSRTDKAAKEAHKKKALEIFKSALAQFQTAIDARGKEVEAKKKQKPKDIKATKAKAEWQKQYDAMRIEYFRVQLEHLNARVRYAKLLKGFGVAAAEWQAELARSSSAYTRLLLDFANSPGETQANLYLGICLMEQGTQKHKDALLRFETVWRKKEMFEQYRRIACEAAYWTAVIQRSQKKFDDAIKTIDGLVEFASDGAWDMEKQPRTVEKIIETLTELEGADRDQYTQRDVARTFLLQAECFADKAADKKTPAGESKKLYGASFDVANAVGQVRGLRDPKYAPLMEKWRRLAGRGRVPVVILQQYKNALLKRQYVRAARLYTELIGQGAVKKQDLRDGWFTVGQCYYAGERHYEAGICFSAVSKWYPEPVGKALEAARAAVGAQHKQAEATKSDFDSALLGRYRIAAEKLDPLGTAGVTIRRAKEHRQKGQFDQAFALLAPIDPQNKAYANALYEIALTHKARFEKLPADRKTSIAGKKALGEMLAGFQKLLDYYRTAAPKLTGEANAEARGRLVAVVGAGLLMLADSYIRPYLNNPKKVIELTDDLEKRYPGIEKTPSASALYMKRMHAAYVVITQAKTAAEAVPVLGIVEESWKAVRKFPDFQFLDRAASIGAYSYLSVASKYDEEAKKLADAAAKKQLADKAAQARYRAVAFYVELLRSSPKQELKIYRYVLQTLKSGGKAEDYKTIIELAPKAIALYGRSRRSFADVLLIRGILGHAHYGLRQYAEAIPYLSAVETYHEKAYQEARRKYEEQKAAYERDPGRFRRAPSPPRRNAAQPDAKEKLAFCYLASSQRDKYEWLERAYNDLLRIYASKPEKFWIIRYNLCETYRRRDKHGDAIKLIDRFHMRDSGMGGSASKERFRRLVGLIRKDIDKLDDANLKATLKLLADELYKRLNAR
ncbi:MAG: hypothetical protein ISS72_00405 [Candidatus Brocadiae bacterium]|nr:hypothetical protein [Candidatus Brocadiia bacterium]